MCSRAVRTQKHSEVQRSPLVKQELQVGERESQSAQNQLQGCLSKGYNCFFCVVKSSILLQKHKEGQNYDQPKLAQLMKAKIILILEEFEVYFQKVSYTQLYILMAQLAIKLTNKTVKQFSTKTADVVQCYDKKNIQYFGKLISVQKSQQLGFSECIPFNEQIFSDLEDYVFKQHLLHIQTEISDQNTVGFITEPYEKRLDLYAARQTIDQKQVMAIFQHMVKAVYSIWMNGYWSRNIRAEHFVKVGPLWKLQCCVFNEDYSKSNGVECEYLWSPKHQAPEFKNGKQYSDDQYNQMIVWNLGSILLNLIVGTHKLSNKSISDKWKGQQFSFAALGINSQRVKKIDQKIKALLASLLHHNPLKRMSLTQLFENKFVSPQVSKHCIENKAALPPSKISIGKSVRNSKLDFASKNILNDLSKVRADRQKQQRQNILGSKIGNSIVDDDQFALQLVSTKVPLKEPLKHRNQIQQEPELQSLQSLLTNKNQNIRKSIQLYKSYYDQSQLLLMAIEKIQLLDFPIFNEEHEVKEIRLLIKYAVTFVSLINLNTLTEGFNGYKNILDLDADQFTSFQNSHQYQAFKRLTNFKRIQRIEQLTKLKNQITFFKKKNLATKQDKIFDFLQRDFKKTNFQDIKIAYRLILKYAYDSISELYNKQKRTARGGQLAQRAMFVTYCLTVDKLYIKEHIPDNFKYYFEWKEKISSNYVPLNEFLDYILKAPKETLIEHSRYILKKFYNI